MGDASSRPADTLRVVFQTLPLPRANVPECCEIDNHEWTVGDGIRTR
jgi:hypothetical protein